MMYVMGFDYGSKRIGMAIGQTNMATARPLTMVPVKNQRPDWGQISTLIDEWQPQALVVGLPHHADGSANIITKAVHRFCNQLKERYNLPVHTIDETLSSIAAMEQKVKEASKRKGKRRKGHQNSITPYFLPLSPSIDAIAAQIILETWFAELIHKSS
jgi:putative Holliday junction resolvase